MLRLHKYCRLNFGSDVICADMLKNIFYLFLKIDMFFNRNKILLIQLTLLKTLLQQNDRFFFLKFNYSKFAITFKKIYKTCFKKKRENPCDQLLKMYSMFF